MPTVKPATITVAFHDQSIGLILFGVLQILLGCACGFTGLLIAAFAMKIPMCHPGVMALRTEALIPAGVSFYLLPAVTLICLGVGSIRARRWAWTLTVILSWFWLIIGLGVIIAQMVFAPTIFKWIMLYHGKISSDGAAFIYVSSVAEMVGFGVLLPLAFLAFYQGAAARATCNWRDPRTYWTDRCPMPVLAASIALASSVVWMSWWAACCCMLALFPCGNLPAWFAFVATCYFVASFGGATSTAFGGVLWLLVIAISAYLARGVYRLKMAAWWGAMLFCVASTAAGAWAFSHSNMIELYEKMCVPSHRWGIVGQFRFVQPSPATFNSLAILAGGMAVCYLLYVHRYFSYGDKTDIVDESVTATEPGANG